MSACTFFGHWHTPDSIKTELYDLIEELIMQRNVDFFYIGNQGHFDRMAYECVRKLKQKYSHIDFNIVLAYISCRNSVFLTETREKSIFPEVLEKTPPRFAIDKRNRWMIEKSDFVITYVTDIVGGAAKYKEIAQKKGKIVLNIEPTKGSTVG